MKKIKNILLLILAVALSGSMIFESSGDEGATNTIPLTNLTLK
jgi:hypothetical protein